MKGAAAAGAASARIGTLLEKIPALVLRVGKQQQGQNPGIEIDFLEHQSSSPSASALFSGG